MSRGVSTGAGASAIVLALVACTARPLPRAPHAGASVEHVAPPVMAAAEPALAATSAAIEAGEPGEAGEPPEPSTDARVSATTTALAPPAAEPATAGPPPPPFAPPLDDGLGGARAIRGDEVQGYVAFTFDDGPHPDWTPRILTALAAHDVHATFFVVARQVWGLDHPARRRELVAIADAGHDIGNHTWSHARLTEIGPIRQAQEIDLASGVIRWITGRPVTIIRPPYGTTAGDVQHLIRQRRLTEVGWSIDPRDWEATTPEILRRRVVARVIRAGGGIIVLHDDKWITAIALPGILADLEAANCRRMADGHAPILPVSLHYFLGRPVPTWVEARTRAYREVLAARCAQTARTRGPAPADPVVDNHTASH